ncbi:hypothetical protein PS2_001614 [Malus domestica]
MYLFFILKKSRFYLKTQKHRLIASLILLIRAGIGSGALSLSLSKSLLLCRSKRSVTVSSLFLLICRFSFSAFEFVESIAYRLCFFSESLFVLILACGLVTYLLQWLIRCFRLNY